MVSRSALLHRLPERVAAGRAMLLEKGWLSLTPPDFQEALLSLAIWKTAVPGEEFSRAGDAEGGLVVVAIGTAEVSVESGHPDTRFVHLTHGGLWTGYRPLLGKARNITMTSRTDLLWALVPQRSLEYLLREEPIYWRYIALMSDMAYETAVSALVDLTRHNGQSRVAGTLLRMAGCRLHNPGPNDNMEIHVPQADIAALAVMSRNTMGAYLADLAGLGLIEVHYRSIRIVDPQGLRNLLDREE